MQADELIRKVVAFADDHGAGGDPFPVGAGGMTLVRQRRPTLIYPIVYQPIFCLVLQGEKQTYLGSNTVRFGAMQSLIVGLDLPRRHGSCVRARPSPMLRSPFHWTWL